MSNDAATNRSQIERIDWLHLGYLLSQIQNNTVLADVFPYVSGRTLQHVTSDRRRKVRQVFTVSLVETPLEDGQ